MTDSRLSDLSLLSVETEVLRRAEEEREQLRGAAQKAEEEARKAADAVCQMEQEQSRLRTQLERIPVQLADSLSQKHGELERHVRESLDTFAKEQRAPLQLLLSTLSPTPQVLLLQDTATQATLPSYNSTHTDTTIAPRVSTRPMASLDSLFRELHRLAGKHPLLIGGDLNSQHTDWGYKTTTHRGRRLWLLLQNLQLSVHNDFQMPTRVGNSVNNPITDINDWVDSFQTDIQHHTQLIETTTDTPTVDDRLAHLWDAYHSLLERWKRGMRRHRWQTDYKKGLAPPPTPPRPIAHENHYPAPRHQAYTRTHGQPPMISWIHSATPTHHPAYQEAVLEARLQEELSHRLQDLQKAQQAANGRQRLLDEAEPWSPTQHCPLQELPLLRSSRDAPFRWTLSGYQRLKVKSQKPLVVPC
ncbi:hypothetical protein HPB52_019802 [Rhipicephalus sanguineus]|uniref:Endonuclease/exonuclease/phosphatase domain-containing protein n=1 Tax=Rhipicephalus sanguineus TaxID=34632 RepID=A0A9D4T1R8_RHISA|nr:hypothetical protein HPB52_019802 [Rhipicephalus sanguineus]